MRLFAAMLVQSLMCWHTVRADRIKKDRETLLEDAKDLQSHGVYIEWPETSRLALKVMVAPSYAGGFYFFDVKLPDFYPMMGPKVFPAAEDPLSHPLYRQWPVCDYNQQDWSPALNITKVLLDFAVRVADPHRDEDGEGQTKVPYYEVALAAFKTFRDGPPPGFKEPFQATMRHLFLKNNQEMVNRLKSERPASREVQQLIKSIGEAVAESDELREAGKAAFKAAFKAVAKPLRLGKALKWSEVGTVREKVSSFLADFSSPTANAAALPGSLPHGPLPPRMQV